MSPSSSLPSRFVTVHFCVLLCIATIALISTPCHAYSSPIAPPVFGLSLLRRDDTRSVSSIHSLAELRSHLQGTSTATATVIRFSSTTCKTCQRSHPPFLRLAAKHSPMLSFVEVKTSEKTSEIFQGERWLEVLIRLHPHTHVDVVAMVVVVVMQLSSSLSSSLSSFVVAVFTVIVVVVVITHTE